MARRNKEASLHNILFMATLESLAVIVTPLLILYLTGRWPMRIVIPSLVVIPVLWYLTYSPIHELSHVLGAYLVGGFVTEAKLIPFFWRGEFAGAGITPGGLTAPWQQLVMTSSPYVLDGVSVAVGFFARHRIRSFRPFALGVAFMLLLLRPTFDLVSETVAYAFGERGDLYHIALATGRATVWLSMATLIGFSLFAIARFLAESTSPAERATT